jgi:ABC-type glycerol-3-phosphate transport system substrate-binding protein
MKAFPAVVMVIFLGLALFGVLIFATFSASQTDQIGDITIWGSVPSEVIDKVVGKIRDTREDFGGVTYREVPKDDLVPLLVEAIAAGRGPDVVFFPSSAIVKDGEKLATIPYDAISRRDFQDAFVEAGEVFIREDGVAGLPISIDPTVMYWNRTLFSNAGIANPPRYWDDLAKLAPQLTDKTANGSLLQSAVPLGLWDNIDHAKLVLVSLVRQLGSPIVSLQESGYRADMFKTDDKGVTPAVSAVRYMADFADPVKPMYSWNRSQKSSRDAFLAGSLALYFAPASELKGLRAANPNLNFDVASLPATRGGGQHVAAEVTAVVIPRGSANPVGGMLVATLFAGPDVQQQLAEELTLPSPRRDVEVDSSSDPYLSVFRASALRSFSFLDPEPKASDAAFQRMMESISSGRTALSEAVRAANEDLQALLKVQ